MLIPTTPGTPPIPDPADPHDRAILDLLDDLLLVVLGEPAPHAAYAQALVAFADWRRRFDALPALAPHDDELRDAVGTTFALATSVAEVVLAYPAGIGVVPRAAARDALAGVVAALDRAAGAFAARADAAPAA